MILGMPGQMAGRAQMEKEIIPVELQGRIRGAVRVKAGGAEGSRTPDLLIANEALSQLSYGPA